MQFVRLHGGGGDNAPASGGLFTVACAVVAHGADVDVSRHPQLVVYLLAFVMVLQVLSFLFTAWSVSFKALVNYRPVASLEDADYVQVRRTSSLWVQ